MSELDSEKDSFGENLDDPNLVREGNPPDFENPPIYEEQTNG